MPGRSHAAISRFRARPAAVTAVSVAAAIRAILPARTAASHERPLSLQPGREPSAVLQGVACAGGDAHAARRPKTWFGRSRQAGNRGRARKGDEPRRDRGARHRLDTRCGSSRQGRPCAWPAQTGRHRGPCAQPRTPAVPRPHSPRSPAASAGPACGAGRTCANLSPARLGRVAMQGPGQPGPLPSARAVQSGEGFPATQGWPAHDPDCTHCPGR